MAIIKCPKCKKEVSDKAEKCPKCAYPIPSTQTHGKTQTIELTGKKYKKQTVYAILASIVGVIIWIGGASSGSIKAFGLGLLLAIGGIIWLIVIKAKIWWHHG